MLRYEFLFPNKFCTQTKKGFKMKVLWHRYKHGYKCAFYTFRSCSLGGEFYIGMFNLTAPCGSAFGHVRILFISK